MRHLSSERESEPNFLLLQVIFPPGSPGYDDTGVCFKNVSVSSLQFRGWFSSLIPELLTVTLVITGFLNIHLC